ncbi:hypothetical protein Pcinc_029503 [Petrolisthes cinctipes]|uniref:Proteasomal ubiquitin receptor ADRM1 homolog n=1 Tax=Petrolisthes cinctipes TaxID=88211 RepID=A0AAE1EZX8_PETCI|nr:hypothetical protein Pcinc_029503 [Petrolisthes cinctipes]
MMALLVFLSHLILLASVSTPVVAAVTLLPRGMDWTEWAWEAVGAVLTSPSLPPSPPHCSLAFITDNNNITTSTSIIQKGRDLSASLGVSVFEVATMKGRDHNNNNNNLTQTHLTRVVTQARQVRVGSWCVSVVVVSRDVELLGSLAHEIRQGRLLQWGTRLVVVTQLDLLTLTHLLHTHWTFAMMNTLMLNKENSRWVLYQHIPYTEGEGGYRVMRVGSWTPKTGLITTSQHFPTKFNNFHGASFPVSVDEESMPLFGVIRKTVQTSTSTQTPGNNNNNNTSTVITFKGRDYIMLLAVGETLNFTPAITLTTSVTQSIQEVVSGKSFLHPLRLVLLPHFLTLVDYTFPIDRASITFSLAKPPIKPQWQSLYYPLRPVVWAAILVLLVAIPPLFVVASNIGGNDGGGGGDRNSSRRRNTLSLLAPARVLLAQDLAHYYPRASSLRLLLATWMIFSFVVGASYRGSLTAFLTIRKYPARPETLEELALTKRPSTFPNGLMWFRDYFLTSRQPATRSVGDLSSLVPTVRTGMDYMAHNRGAFFYERYYMQLAIAEHYSDLWGDTDLYVAKENVLPNYAAWFVPHDAPYKHSLDLVLARIIEAGLKDKWLEDVMRETKMEIRIKKLQQSNIKREGDNVGGGDGDVNGDGTAKESSKDEGSDESVNRDSIRGVVSGREQGRQSLTLTHLQGPFWLLLLGMVAALVALLIEVPINMSSALFGASTRSSSKNLVEFRCGKMYLKGQMVHPDKRKGQLYLYQADDSLMHFCWKDRGTGTVEEDLIVFPDDCLFKRVNQCTTGRVYVLIFRSSVRRLFFWMQEPKTDKDEEHCRKVNELMNNPPTPGSSSRTPGSSSSNPSAALSSEITNIRDADLQNIFGNISQQQLMQFLGSGMSSLATLLGPGSGSSGGSGRGSSSGGGSGSDSTPSTPAATTTTTPSATTPTTTTTTTSTTTVSAPPAAQDSAQSGSGSSGNESSSGGTPGSNVVPIQLSDLQNILSGITVPPDVAGSPRVPVDLSSAMTAEALQPILTNEAFVEELRPYLPATAEELPPTEQLRGTVTSPQFQQAVSLFSSALQSGQLGPLINQFGLGEDAVLAASSCDMEAFIKALGKKDKDEGSKKEEEKKNADKEKDQDKDDDDYMAVD